MSTPRLIPLRSSTLDTTLVLTRLKTGIPLFGQGAAGYGKRFGAGLAGQASSEFFKDFAYPTMFSEDPRYYRLTRGGNGTRLLHAAGHAFIARREDGTLMFNFSEWLGMSSVVALSNVYHPDYACGFSSAAQRIGYAVLGDAGIDVLREFWPETSRKLKLPFRGQQNSPAEAQIPHATKYHARCWFAP